MVQILHTHACFEKRGEYVVLSASSKNGGSSTAGPMGMVTQVPTKTYAGLYTFKCVYKHYIYLQCTYLFFTVSISFYPDFTLILFVIGLYVFKSVYGHYVVGPTNVPQDSKEDRGCDVDNVADMKNHIFSYFPGYL